jgi:phosphoglycerate kinase
MVKSIKDYDFKAKKALIRVDFNVPLDDSGNITDTTRLVSSLPTIEHILEGGGIPVLMSHLGRPKGKASPELSLKPVANWLEKRLNSKVYFAETTVGSEAKKTVDNAEIGDMVLLENLRFFAEEEKNDSDFAKKLSELGDVYINDAFGTAHRAHASTAAVAVNFADKFPGLLMQKELDYLGDALSEPKRPFTAIIGGAKISGKIDVIKALLGKADHILIGGGMMFTFLKALGHEVGNSIVEEDKLELADEIIQSAKSTDTTLHLPTDVVLADKFSEKATTKTSSIENMDIDMMGLDIGIDTIEHYNSIIIGSETIIWNGPMGVFELKPFEEGTKKIAKSMAVATEKGSITIVGGGDSAAAISKFGLSDQVSHVSTGGGASLEFLEGKILPGVKALG